MKLLVGTHYFDTHMGGVEIVASQLAHALATQPGIAITWMASDATEPSRDFPGSTISLPCWNATERHLGLPLPMPSVRSISLIRDAVKSSDAVLLHDVLYPTNAAAAWFARRFARPLVVVQHVGLVPYSSRSLRAMMHCGNKWLAAPILRRADQVVFISGLTQRYFANITSFRRPPMLVFNGIRTDLRNAGSAIPRNEAREALGLPLNRFVALFVGRFVEKKGLAVIRRLATDLPDLDWLMCGWGPMDPTRWRAKNVRVLGRVDTQSLNLAYRAADVLVLPSVGEGLPLVVQEALASGIGVLGSDELLVADPWLEGKIVTTPVDTDDLEATVASWRSALIQYGARDRIPRPSVDETCRRYSWYNAAGTYADMLSRLVFNQDYSL